MGPLVVGLESPSLDDSLFPWHVLQVGFVHGMAFFQGTDNVQGGSLHVRVVSGLDSSARRADRGRADSRGGGVSSHRCPSTPPFPTGAGSKKPSSVAVSQLFRRQTHCAMPAPNAIPSPMAPPRGSKNFGF